MPERKTLFRLRPYRAPWIAMKKFRPGSAAGGRIGASGPMGWIARAGGQKVTIRVLERVSFALVPARFNFFSESVGHDRDLDLVASAALLVIERRTELTGEPLHDSAEAIHRGVGDTGLGIKPWRLDR